MLKRLTILDYPVLDETAPHVARAVCDELDARGPKSFIFLNPHSVIIAEREPAFRRVILSAHGIFCDGVGLSLASLMLNRQRAIRVYGYEFFRALSTEMSGRRVGRVFFLGGTPDSLEELVTKFQAEYPGIAAVGSYAPPYRDEFEASEIEEMVGRIRDFGADVLWIGLGSPKQEKVLAEIVRRLPLSCAAAIGAVFDFYTGRVPHAPAWIRRIGLQWAHRLLLEPRRLWRRTLISSPAFVWLVVRRMLRANGPPRRQTS